MIRDLVALPTVSSVNPRFDQGNRAAIDRLGGWLDDAGLRVDVEALDTDPPKANLVATVGEGDGGLVLAGHVDTVPCDPGLWRGDPYTLHERDGRLYGLGVADMKGFLAMSVAAAARAAATPLAAPVTVVVTADEESRMTGARHLAASGRTLGRHVVIGEPTGLTPVYAHKGVMMEAICLRGRSGHSSDPALGDSALDGMQRVLTELVAWRSELQARYRDPDFEMPVPTLNLGYIHGGDNPNRICGECELHIDLRPLPGMVVEALRSELRERVAHSLDGSSLDVGVEALFPGVPPFRAWPDSPVVRAVADLTGRPPRTVAFGTEGPFFAALGLDVVIAGPGDIAQAHQPDEYLALDRLDPTERLLDGLVHRFCHDTAASRGADDINPRSAPAAG